MVLVKDLLQRGIPASQAEMLGDVLAGISANGTTQETGTLVTGSLVSVGAATAGVNDAITLLPIEMYAQSVLFIRNDDPVDTINVFPAVGGQFNTLALNASIAITAGNSRIFFKANTAATPTRWCTT